MIFNKPILCDVEYTGLNLTNVNTPTVKFAYIANDGSIQYSQNSVVTADPSSGTMKVSDGGITTNSRYGFVN